ncbi:MAG: hypothetical protein WKF74_12105 [Pyrinomonadaceae bacterium]
MSIIVSKDGKNAQKLERTVIQLENYLQQYIAENPNSLPLYEIDENIKLLVLAREFSTGSGPIDALGVDGEANIYIIETKLYKNADKRIVVAQMLDYGASLWSNFGDANDFMAKLDTAVNAKFNVALSQKLEEFYGLEVEAVIEFLERLKQNVREGRFRFVVLMDRLDKRLKDLIAFVNRNSRFDILGVEWNFYQHQDFEILIPNLYGAEIKKEVDNHAPVGTVSGARGKWDEQSFFAELARRVGTEEAESIHEFYIFSDEHADEIAWGSGNHKGSFSSIFRSISDRSLYTVNSHGSLQLNFNWHGDSDSSGYAEKFGQKLQQLAGFDLPPDYMQRRIGVAVEQWMPKLAELIEVIKNTIPRADRSE